MGLCTDRRMGRMLALRRGPWDEARIIGPGKEIVTSEDRVLVAGTGGASLGTEILKSLMAAGGYQVFGCDVSPSAYGLYESGFSEAFLLPKDNFASAVMNVCLEHKIPVVIPGGEAPLRLLLDMNDQFREHGITVACNDPEVARVCLDKTRFQATLRRLSLPSPWSMTIEDLQSLETLRVPEYPCVVKPATGSGGSKLVLLAGDWQELDRHVRETLAIAGPLQVQEYIPEDEGEFTVGVLSLPDVPYLQSLVMRRVLDSPLSVASRTVDGVISTGITQGFVDDFPNVRETAEGVAQALNSVGPLNIQGRLHGGKFLSFEANPRFSASTFLRTMAGFNEIDSYLQHLLHGTKPPAIHLRRGFYLRSFTEMWVSPERWRNDPVDH